MLECHDIYKDYHQTQALKPISFKVKQGEIVGIMGESGSGKSTLAKLIAGLEPLSGGSIFLSGSPYDTRNPSSRILLVFQDALHAVNPRFLVREILSEGMKGDYQYEELVQILEDVGLDAQYLQKRPSQLSGGQLQRVCIARALLLKPDLIVFDEALSGLDPIIQGQLLKLLVDLKDRYDLTYIFVSHDFKLCYAICHRVLILFEGQLVEELKQLDHLPDLDQLHPVTQQIISEDTNCFYPKCRLRKMI